MNLRVFLVFGFSLDLLLALHILELRHQHRTGTLILQMQEGTGFLGNHHLPASVALLRCPAAACPRLHPSALYHSSCDSISKSFASGTCHLHSRRTVHCNDHTPVSSVRLSSSKDRDSTAAYTMSVVPTANI